MVLRDGRRVGKSDGGRRETGLLFMSNRSYRFSKAARQAGRKAITGRCELEAVEFTGTEVNCRSESKITSCRELQEVEHFPCCK